MFLLWPLYSIYTEKQFTSADSVNRELDVHIDGKAILKYHGRFVP
jgi:hypothetical protein